MRVVRDYVHSLRAHDLHGDEFVIVRKEGNKIDVDVTGLGSFQNLVNFCANDILGLAQHPAVQQAAAEAIASYGASSSSSSALCGRTVLHRNLEAEISSTKQLPHTHLFLNAWMAIQAFVDAFCHLAIPVPGFRQPKATVILSDLLNHSSINSAVANAHKLTGTFTRRSDRVRTEIFRHRDADDLRKRLARHVKGGERIVVVSDSVFSMDGDVAPLPEFVDVLSEYDDTVLVFDEAHATGAIGRTGRGICEHHGVTPQAMLAKGVNPILLTTFSKFAASAGAAISTDVAELLQVMTLSPTSFGTAALTPPNVASALESFRILRQSPDLVSTLQGTATYARSQLHETGFQTLGSTHVVPVVLPEGIHPKHFARHLMQHYGVWVSAVWYVTRPRLRIVVNALHTREDVDRLIEGLTETRSHFLREGPAAPIPAPTGPKSRAHHLGDVN
jgi:glycine C-acetyltransferase